MSTRHPTNPYFSTFLTVSPAGDKMTTDFAKTVIAEEGLGDDEITDYLGVSYSATDYIGHFFGPVEPGVRGQHPAARPGRSPISSPTWIGEIGLEKTLDRAVR